MGEFPSCLPRTGNGARRWWCIDAGRGPAVAALTVILVLAAAMAGAAEKPATVTFMGAAVVPASGTYVVLKDVNIRALPKTASKRLGRLKKADQVEAVGRPKDAAWLAVRKDGKNLGFVFAPLLMPLIDGALTAAITGGADGPAGACRYTIRFDRKNRVEGEVFETADYDVDFACGAADDTTVFSAFMFITEAPYQLSQNPIYQVSVDIKELRDCCDETPSTTLFFNRKEKRVVLEAVVPKEFARLPKSKERPAKDVPAALRRAVELALASWNMTMWTKLGEARP